jgi:hypothetical protein
MTVVVETDRILLQGDCGSADAEPLMAALREMGDLPVDLSAAEHLHTAILQILLAFRPVIAGSPRDTFTRTWLIPNLAAEPLPATEHS